MWVLYGYTGLCLFTFRLRRGLALFLREIKNARKGFFKTALFFFECFCFPTSQYFSHFVFLAVDFSTTSSFGTI